MFFDSNVLSNDKVKPYLAEIKKSFNDLKFYFDNSGELTKSVAQFYLADIWFKYATAEGFDVPLDKVDSLASAKLVVSQNMFLSSKDIPYVNGTRVLVDILRFTHIAMEYGIIPLDFLIKDIKNWNGLYFKNVDFHEVEISIENKDIFGFIKPNNCTFENCNFKSLRYIVIPEDKNNFVNCVIYG